MLECGEVRRSMAEAASSSSTSCVCPGEEENRRRKENRGREKRKVLLGQESSAAPRNLGWAAQGEKERKSGLHMRETNGPNSNFDFFYIYYY
jgi:hypothetical protein